MKPCPLTKLLLDLSDAAAQAFCRLILHARTGHPDRLREAVKWQRVRVSLSRHYQWRASL